MVPGLAVGKPARSAPKAAYSIVASSDTRNAATLATQNTGQGEVFGGWMTAAAAGTVAGVMAEGSGCEGRECVLERAGCVNARCARWMHECALRALTA